MNYFLQLKKYIYPANYIKRYFNPIITENFHKYLTDNFNCYVEISFIIDSDYYNGFIDFLYDNKIGYKLHALDRTNQLKPHVFNANMKCCDILDITEKLPSYVICIVPVII